ncbi:MAG TPA: LamG-like jellyroll fold domain-containing protein [Verrucomicrobiae bacterium]|nr:LamG-like jellyroll fold domain-containing protein [Verrucomicrobiae bacterium]
MVAWWPLDGNGEDIVGSNDGTLLGSPVFVAGKVNQAMQFDYANDAVRVPANPTLDVGKGAGFTIEGWIKSDNLAVQHPIVEWNNDAGTIGAHFWTSQMGFDGKISSLFANIVDTTGLGHGIRTAPDLLTTDRFYHVALTYDKATGVAAIYINGANVAQENLGTFTPLTSAHFYVGLRSSGPASGNRFAGKIDELSLYNRALNASELQAIYAADSSGKCRPDSVPPTITRQPENQTVPVGGSATFTVTVGGTEPFSYQWRRNGEPITGAIERTLTLNDVQSSQAGAYSVVVNNASGTATSDNATLTVTEAPTSCSPPPADLVAWWPFDGSAQDVAGNNNGTLVGNPAFKTGEVGQALHFDYLDDAMRVPANPALDVGQSSGFTIEGWIKSDDLTVQHPIVEWNNDAGSIGTHFWTSQMGFDGQISSLFANIIDTTGVGHGIRTPSGLLTTDRFYHVALTYDKASGVATIYIDGSRVAQENLGTFTPQTSSHFYVGLRSSGTATGNRFAGDIDELSLYNRALSGAELHAIFAASSLGKCKPAPVAPTITAQPQSQTVSAGDTVTFTVSASGTQPFSYQWRHNGEPIGGATQSSLTLHDVQPSQAGAYSVLVINAAGSATSADAQLTVLPTGDCAPPPEGLIAWWPFDGNAHDIIGNNDGTLFGDPVFVSGRVGQALQFDYQDDAMRVPANGSLDVGRGKGFTIEGWIKPDDLTVQHPIVEWNDDVGGIGAHFWTSHLGFDGQIASLIGNIVDTDGVSHGIRSPSNLLTTGRFYHVALTYDKHSGIAAIYINGVKVAEENLGRFTPQTSSNFYVGLRSSGTAAGNRFAGKIDELSLYDRALAGEELNAIYTAGSAGKCKPPAITPVDAVDAILQVLRGYELPRGIERPLAAALEKALREFQRGDVDAGADALRAFQEKAEKTLLPGYPAQAGALIQAAQMVIDAL